jgi:uncharacterized protein YjbI with pentapeptide repeats
MTGSLPRRAALALLILALGSSVASAQCSDPPEPKVDWTKCQKQRKVMRGQDLRDGRFERTDFSFSDLSETQLTGAFLVRANLTSSTLSGADLRRANLGKVLGSRTNFEDANLAGAVLSKAELNRAKMSRADLTDADLSKTELGRVPLIGAKLNGTDLSYANIARSDFNGSSLVGTNLTGAYTFQTRITGTDLSQAIGLTQWQLDLACGDGATKLPSGLERPGSWPCGPEND